MFDANHSQRNPVAWYSWIKRREDYPIRFGTGRRRLKISGALDMETRESVIHYAPTMNAPSTIALLRQLEDRHPEATKIYVSTGNARCYRSGLVAEYLQTSRIALIFLPPHGPNLNLMERYRKSFKKKILYGNYCEACQEFREAGDASFASQRTYISGPHSLSTEKFEVLSA